MKFNFREFFDEFGPTILGITISIPICWFIYTAGVEKMEYDREEKRQVLKYAELAGGHMRRYRCGQHTNFSTLSNGNTTSYIPYTEDEYDWEVVKKDGTVITCDELKMRGAINPSVTGYEVQLLEE